MYNRRILDLMKYIEQKFNIKYGGGWPVFSKPSPAFGEGSLSDSAWNWLSMYNYDFHFVCEVGEVTDKTKFSIVLRSDSGVLDRDVKQTDIAGFGDVTKATTQ